MALDLSPFGWDGLSLRYDLRDLAQSLPTWSHLKVLEDEPTTSLRFPNGAFTSPDVSGSFMPAYTKGTVINTKGGYSTIYKVRRTIYACKILGENRIEVTPTASSQDIAMKEHYLNITREEDAATPSTKHTAYDEEISAILYEAVIHVLVYKCLERSGVARYTPRMYEIVANGVPPHDAPTQISSILFCMELLHGSTMEDYLKRVLIKSAKKRNEAILTDFLIQIAYVLHLLQTDLRFHHRDLKLNNVYQRESSAVRDPLVLPNGVTWVPTLDLVLLDYGFSCIACGTLSRTPRSTLVGAGSWFTLDDDCCKEGRDLAQLIFSIHCNFPLADYVGSEYLAFFTKIMTATDHGRPIQILNGFTVDGRPHTRGQPVVHHNGVYFFLKRNSVEIPLCAPAAFLEGLLGL
jgi:serine/threonine protein kinase